MMALSITQPADFASHSICPNIGQTGCLDIDQLIAKAKRQITRITRKECYVTAEHWDFANTLEQIQSLCRKKGDWGRALRKIGLLRQRASEYIQYRKVFPTRADAAACPVLKANLLIRKSLKAEDAAARNAGADDDCFATPAWLLEVLRRDYGDFGLDAAASHGHAAAAKYYTADDDALQQDWASDSAGRPVFMNPPFTAGNAEEFIKKAYGESQRREPTGGYRGLRFAVPQILPLVSCVCLDVCGSPHDTRSGHLPRLRPARR